MASNKYLVRIETTQPSNFRTLFNTLKDNDIYEANIIINNDCMEILEMETHNSVIIYVKLLAQRFETFECSKPIRIGVDVGNLTKVLKTVPSKSTLTLFVKSNDYLNDDTNASIQVGIQIDDVAKGQSYTYLLCTRDVNVNDITVPEPGPTYPYFIQLPSNNLQVLMNSLKNTGGEIVKILFNKDKLQFFTKGEIGCVEVTTTKTDVDGNSMLVQKQATDDESNIIEIYARLDRLIEFSKCSNLSQVVTLYLKNDFPLFLEYDVGSLGFIRMGLSLNKKPDDF